MAFLLIDMSSPKQLDGIVPTPDSTVGALLLGTLLGLMYDPWACFPDRSSG